jgi:hypothetical protein
MRTMEGTSKIYIVNHYGEWDGSFRNILSFSKYEDALKEYKKQVADAKMIFADSFGEDEGMIMDEDETSCVFYADGDYNNYHEIIELLTCDLK